MMILVYPMGYDENEPMIFCRFADIIVWVYYKKVTVIAGSIYFHDGADFSLDFHSESMTDY